MRYALAILLLYGFSLGAFAFCSVTDDKGRIVSFNDSAKRVITLAPHLTEILYEINSGEKIVGTVSSSDYPKAAMKLTRIGSYSGLDSERIFTLHPDLIIAWGDQFGLVLASLKKKGIAVYISEPKSLTDIPKTMQNLGCLLGKKSEADKVAGVFLQKLATLKAENGHGKVKRVFFQVGSYSLFTVNQDSWINQVIEGCGGRNIYKEAAIIAPMVNLEAVIKANPEVIISDADNQHWKERWLNFKQLTAVKKNRLISVQADLIDRPGPRLLQGMESICQQMRYSQID